MIYLATASTPQVRDAMRSGVLGQMVTPAEGKAPEPGVTWALDNGCFSAKWTAGKWFATLDRWRDAPGCLFAVVPDVVGDSVATDARWERYAGVVHACGYKAAYVLQNGCTAIPDNADAVFVGGDTEWKLGIEAHRLVRAALKRGLWAHMGRVNSRRRIRIAADWGCHSTDGTMIARGPDINLRRLERMVDPDAPGFFGGVA